MGVLLLLVLAGASSEAARLFDEGRADLKAGRVTVACDKLAASQSLEPALGTLLNLAVCLEASGKTASALLRFNEGEAWATRINDRPRAQLASDKARALKPKLAWLHISLSDAPAGAEVSAGEVWMPLTPGGVTIPVDPGSVVVRARAPGYVTTSQSVAAPPPSATTRLVLPALALSGEPKPSAQFEPWPRPPTPPTPERASPSLAPVVHAVTVAEPVRGAPAGAVVGLVASGLVLTGGAIGLGWALTVAEQIRLQQVTGLLTTTRRQYDAAVMVHPMSLIAIAVGAVGCAISTVFILRRPVQVVPTVSRDSTSITASVSFE